MKKKLISVIMAAVLIIGAVMPVIAASDRTVSVPCFMNAIEKPFGALVSVISGAFENIGRRKEVTKGEKRDAAGKPTEETLFTDSPDITLDAMTFVCNEVTFTSAKEYTDPFNAVDVDMILVGNGRKFVIPCFWDGAGTWKCRFICPEEGEWYFVTNCTDKDNTGLEGITGKVNCKKYDGELDIYKHGFVTTRYGEKYLTYEDGTPFFYLGDTHWSLGDETAEMVQTICDKRVSQGYTVFQSEPIGEKFNFTDGITEADMEGLHNYDKKFEIIANHGLVHANAEFFFTGDMGALLNNFGESYPIYLDKISRYWAARYSAYPVLWALGQETDSDFYGAFTRENNPYLLIADFMSKYDAYNHPVTSHQENAGRTTASNSVFKNSAAHTWFGAQYSVPLTKRNNYKTEKDFYYNSDGKPVINYEGRYCYLWTKNFGARAQGWCSLLSGMYGYAWGGHDTWSYLNTYNEDEDSTDGVDIITSEEKINATWLDALEYPSSYQTGYMKAFLEDTVGNWYELLPRFDNRAYFSPCAGVYYAAAGTENNDKTVIYFYSFSDPEVGAKKNASAYGGVLTGTVGKLIPREEYKYIWFDPQTGEHSEEESFTASVFGTHYIGARISEGVPVDRDMVLYIYR